MNMDAVIDRYIAVGTRLDKQFESKRMSFDDANVKKSFDHFKSRYRWETLTSLSDKKILERLFDNKRDSLAYDCCTNTDYESFGSVGTRNNNWPTYKKDNKWRTKDKIIAETEAIKIAKEFSEALINIQKKIEKINEQSNFSSLKDYEELVVYIKSSYPQFHYYTNWCQKLLQMLYPDLFSEIYSEDWQKNALFSLALIPSDDSLCRNGQLALVARNTRYHNAWYFANAYYKLFGYANSFEVYRYDLNDYEKNDFVIWEKNKIIGLPSDDKSDVLRKVKCELKEGMICCWKLIVATYNDLIIGIGFSSEDSIQHESKQLITSNDLSTKYVKKCNWIIPEHNIVLKNSDRQSKRISKITSDANLILIYGTFFNFLSNTEQFNEIEAYYHHRAINEEIDKESLIHFVDVDEVTYQREDVRTDADYVDAVNEYELEDSIFAKDDLCDIQKTIVTTERFRRDVKVGRMALARANNLCEYNNKHESFIRYSDGNIYMEPHHLVPISQQDKFDHSLDVPANVVSLCSNCHNCIHYGVDSEEMIEALYELRREELEESGIYITLDALKKMYRKS
ncbi:MAG: hypothetical protein MJ172_11495 [Clostridia bacterium]|nr:hypothetical protein [Clostridia bacterium]